MTQPRPFDSGDLKFSCQRRCQSGVLVISPERDQWEDMGRETHYSDSLDDLARFAIAYRDRVNARWDGAGDRPYTRINCCGPDGQHVQLTAVMEELEQDAPPEPPLGERRIPKTREGA